MEASHVQIHDVLVEKSLLFAHFLYYVPYYNFVFKYHVISGRKLNSYTRWREEINSFLSQGQYREMWTVQNKAEFELSSLSTLALQYALQQLPILQVLKFGLRNFMSAGNNNINEWVGVMKNNFLRSENSFSF